MMALDYDEIVALAKSDWKPSRRLVYVERAIGVRRERIRRAQAEADRARAEEDRQRALVVDLKREILDLERLKGHIAPPRQEPECHFEPQKDRPSVDLSSLVRDLVARGLSEDAARTVAQSNEVSVSDLNPARSGDGQVWRGLSSPCVSAECRLRTVSVRMSDRIPEQLQRALTIPGYLHAMIMAQATFADPEVLDAKAAYAGEHGIPPLGLSPVYVKNVLDADVLSKPEWIRAALDDQSSRP